MAPAYRRNHGLVLFPGPAAAKGGAPAQGWAVVVFLGFAGSNGGGHVLAPAQGGAVVAFLGSGGGNGDGYVLAPAQG